MLAGMSQVSNDCLLSKALSPQTGTPPPLQLAVCPPIILTTSPVLQSLPPCPHGDPPHTQVMLTAATLLSDRLCVHLHTILELAVDSTYQVLWGMIRNLRHHLPAIWDQ